MSRTQLKPDGYRTINEMGDQIAALQRQATATVLKDIDTTGLTSAQIDAAVFGPSTNAQPTNGLMIVDSANSLLLARVGGKWGTTSLTLIS